MLKQILQNFDKQFSEVSNTFPLRWKDDCDLGADKIDLETTQRQLKDFITSTYNQAYNQALKDTEEGLPEVAQINSKGANLQAEVSYCGGQEDYNYKVKTLLYSLKNV